MSTHTAQHSQSRHTHRAGTARRRLSRWLPVHSRASAICVDAPPVTETAAPGKPIWRARGWRLCPLRRFQSPMPLTTLAGAKSVPLLSEAWRTVSPSTAQPICTGMQQQPTPTAHLLAQPRSVEASPRAGDLSRLLQRLLGAVPGSQPKAWATPAKRAKYFSTGDTASAAARQWKARAKSPAFSW